MIGSEETDPVTGAIEEEEYYHEGMPLFLDHIDPIVSKSLYFIVYKHACCFNPVASMSIDTALSLSVVAIYLIP